MTSIERSVWIDNLRALATIFVILVHVSMASRASSINVDIIYGAFSRFCVPAFVMISGALLLPKEQPLTVFLKKLLFRIIVPFAFWSCVYIAINIHKSISAGDVYSTIGLLKNILMYLIQGAELHLWFVYMIIGVYLFIPILSRWINNCPEVEVQYFLLVWIVVQVLNLPYLVNFKLTTYLPSFTGYIGYLVLGYYLSKLPLKRSSLVGGGGIMLLTGYIFTAAGTYLLSIQSGEFDHTLYEYLRPNIIFLSAGAFLFVRGWPSGMPKNAYGQALRNFISRYSYGIYLIHWLVLVQLGQFGIHWNMIHPWVGVLLTTVSCLLISCLLVWGISKLPMGKYISGQQG